MIPRSAITLGILAGGRGQRLGGRDKAWVPYRQGTLVENVLAAFDGNFAERLVSARAPDTRFTMLGLRPVFDRRQDFAGPLAALEALSVECSTAWLLTTPVDIDGLPADIVDRLRAASGDNGAMVTDAGGLQPLLGMWNTASLKQATKDLLDAGESAAHRLVARLQPARLDISPLCLVNFNTPQDFPEGPMP